MLLLKCTFALWATKCWSGTSKKKLLIESFGNLLGLTKALTSTGDSAAVTDAVNSCPVATAHCIIDDTAVGRGVKKKKRRDFKGGQLITPSLTAIHCRGGGKKKTRPDLKSMQAKAPSPTSPGLHGTKLVAGVQVAPSPHFLASY